MAPRWLFFPSSAPPPTGKSVQFNNGVSDESAYVDSPGRTDGQGAMFGWIKFNTLPSVNSLYIIHSFGGSTAGSTAGYLAFAVRYNTVNIGASQWRLEIIMRVNGFSQLYHVYTTTNVTTGTWYFISFESSGTAWSISVNGTAQSLTSFIGGSSNNGNWYIDASPAGTQKWSFGRRYLGGVYDNPISAQMHQFGYLNRELTAGERTSLYASGVPRTFAQTETILGEPLVRWYPFADPTDVTGTLIETVVSENLTTTNMDSATNYISDVP